MEIDRVEQYIHTGRGGRIKGLYGRVVRTHLAKPVLLADEVDRRLVLVMGPQGIASLAGKSHFDMVLLLGHKASYIESELCAGRRFKLVVFEKQPLMRIATWKNVIDATASAYPELESILRRALPALKGHSFERLQELAGFSFAGIHKTGVSDPRFMTAERLLESDGGVVAVRRFLYHTVRLTELYSGDGFTKTSNGQRGVREYIARNVRIDELTPHKVIDLPMRQPENCD